MQKKQTDDRMKYIYSEHKKGRSYTDIGRELGITAARVGQYYRRMDFRLNGYKADHFHPLYKASGKVTRNLPIRDGIHIREYHLPSETKKEQELDYNQEKQYVTAIWENIVYEKCLDRKSFSDFQRRVDILRNLAQKHSWDLEIDADDGTPGIVRLYGSFFSADNRDLMPVIFYSNVNASRPEENMMVLKTGLEPVRPCEQGILSPRRLPFRHFSKNTFYFTIFSGKNQVFLGKENRDAFAPRRTHEKGFTR